MQPRAPSLAATQLVLVRCVGAFACDRSVSSHSGVGFGASRSLDRDSTPAFWGNICSALRLSFGAPVPVLLAQRLSSLCSRLSQSSGSLLGVHTSSVVSSRFCSLSLSSSGAQLVSPVVPSLWCGQRETPNQTLELTASRRTTQLCMTFIPSSAAERAPARSTSAYAR